MWNETRNGKTHQEDYINFKKTIREIVGMRKNVTPEKKTKIKKKKPEPLDTTETLMRQFLDLQQFQKGLAAATLDGNENKNNFKKSKSKGYTGSSSEESKYSKISTSSSSSRTNNKNNLKERLRREEYNTDELTDTSYSDDSRKVTGNATKKTVPGKTFTEVTSFKNDNIPKTNSGLAASGKKQNETSSVQQIKKKCILSPSELAIIKDLCRDLIKKEVEPKENNLQISKLTIKKEEEYSKVGADIGMITKIVEEDITKTSENEKNQIYKNKPENTKKNEYNLEIQNTQKTEYELEKENISKKEYKLEKENGRRQKNNTELDIIKNHNYNFKIENTKNEIYNMKLENIAFVNLSGVESTIYENTSTEETPELLIEQNEINVYDEQSNEDIINGLIVKEELTRISEHKEDTITADGKLEKVHLEIVTKETVEEVDEWKQRIEEKVVIEKTVLVNSEEAEVIQEVEKETKEVAFCNMSDDDLIRKTMSEINQIDQEFMMEKASPEDENEYYYYEEARDGDNMEEKRNLQQRIDILQEQILSLRTQLEEAKRQNEQEAQEIGYLSALLGERESTSLRSN